MYTIATNPAGRFFLRHADHPGLAYAKDASGWVQHVEGAAVEDFTVDTFPSEDAADLFATEEHLYPRRD
jgi:hypothetical protein